MQVSNRLRTPPRDLDAFPDPTELGVGGQLTPSITQYVSVFTDSERSESMLYRTPKNSESKGRGFNSRRRLIEISKL